MFVRILVISIIFRLVGWISGICLVLWGGILGLVCFFWVGLMDYELGLFKFMLIMRWIRMLFWLWFRLFEMFVLIFIVVVSCWGVSFWFWECIFWIFIFFYWEVIFWCCGCMRMGFCGEWRFSFLVSGVIVLVYRFSGLFRVGWKILGIKLVIMMVRLLWLLDFKLGCGKILVWLKVFFWYMRSGIVKFDWIYSM